MDAAYAFLSILAVSLVSFVGIVAFSLQERFMKKILFVLVGLAAGALLGDAIFHLIPEAIQNIENERVFGITVIAGILFFFILEKYLRWHHAHHGAEEEHTSEEAEHHPAHLAPLVLVADGVHNMVDGAVIAASFLISPVIGVTTTIAVFLHEIPQEVADYALLVHSGLSRGKAVFFNFLSALTAFFGAFLVFLLNTSVESLGAYAGAFTAGAFIYIAATDLVPELQKSEGLRRGLMELAAFTGGIILMFALTFFE